MRNNENFNYFMKGLDSKLQAQLNYYYARQSLLDELNHKREMEQMKREIIEEVMARVAVKLEDEALKQLRDLLNDMFGGMR